jgi:hypothetical protein
MIRRLNITCIVCREKGKAVRRYITERQKAYINILPFPFCEVCAKSRGDLMLYEDYIAQTELGCRLAPANIAELC